MAINNVIDLFNPRKALTTHLQQLVEQGIIRGVGQAQDLSDVLDGREPSMHGFVYVTFDKSKNISTQGKNTIKSTEVYTVTLAWRNNHSERSNHGQGMDEAGEVKAALEFYINGWVIGSDKHSQEYASPTMGKPFVLSESSPEAFYRPDGWAYYPMAFEIMVTRVRPQSI
ncbi:hypothetical protein [Psychrobacter sp. I-STPA10]|uniref:hypothetical protein n=1 Tax=Psychrobacter sp. I-STPA10 TaxID=2585769 RepID=UPI001E388C9B|nr:hypothetical protein [Psychrobacter sp. I-STPA10]